TFTVKARNEAGYGDESAPSNAVTPEAEIVTGRPSAPLNVTADAGDAYAVVSWSAPADDGGLPITEYAVTSSPSGIVVTTGGNTSCRFNGLVNDTEYTFTVTAKNNEGVSDASAPSNPVTPESGVIDPPNPDEGSWIAAVGSWNEEVIGTWNDGQIEPIEPTDCSWVSMEDSWNDFSPLATYERSGTYLLRTDLPIGGHETNTTITRVYPYVEGTAKLEFRFGSQQHAGGPVSWVGGFREFSPGKDRKIDVRTTGELHAYEVRSKDGFFKLTGMDIEYSMAGVR
ncbi:MAG: fibronectin type III domain-containing protein, partial [bacterium]|nr:fibronectin type III domain-containing protein [bacterium]